MKAFLIIQAVVLTYLVYLITNKFLKDLESFLERVERANEFLDKVKLLDSKSFRGTIKRFEDNFQVKTALENLRMDSVRSSVASELAKFADEAEGEVSEFSKYYYHHFFDKTVIGWVLRVEKIYKETLKDSGNAEYEFCKLNIPGKYWTSQERIVMWPVMKLVSYYFAAKLFDEVEGVDFGKLYDAINKGFEKRCCLEYKAGGNRLGFTKAGT